MRSALRRLLAGVFLAAAACWRRRRGRFGGAGVRDARWALNVGDSGVRARDEAFNYCALRGVRLGHETGGARDWNTLADPQLSVRRLLANHHHVATLQIKAHNTRD